MNWIERNDNVLMNTYGVRNIVLERGEGSYVWDIKGKRYLDFLGGIAVNVLGHCHPAFVKAITEQVGRLHHTTNLYYIPRSIELAEVLTSICGLEGAKAFFCNSGAEANEAALKIARLYSNKNYENQGGRPNFITFEGSFHGRTFATIAASGQSKVREGFGPHFDFFRYAKFNDLASVEALLDDSVAAIMVEPIQGEGGIVPADSEFLLGLRRICDERDMALIFDEIQCGMGRTGSKFAFQHFGIEPDIITLAKALGGGIPIGACLARGKWAEVFTPGKHGTTFGGNPFACAAGLAVCRIIFDDAFIDGVREASEKLIAGLQKLKSDSGIVEDVRGAGLMVGIVLKEPGATLAAQLADAGLLVNCTAVNVLRLLPPLNVTSDQIDEALDILGKYIH